MARIAELQAFYASKRWIMFKRALVAERGPICQKCGKIVTNPLDLIGHHSPVELTLANMHDPMVALNPKNVILICHDCHNQEHERFGYKPERMVYLVYGAPLSGKHTFTRQQMRRNDILVDMDALYVAISGLPMFEKPDCLYRNVSAVHDLLLDNIKTRYGKWQNAFVIGGYPEKRKRDALADSLGAELVYCEADKTECMLRLKQDEHRKQYAAAWAGYINDWFDRYTA